MGWIFTISLVIVLIIAGFMLFIFMPKPLVFFEVKIDTSQFTESHDEIKKFAIEQLGDKPIFPIYFDEVLINPNNKLFDIISETFEPLGIFCSGLINLKPNFNQIKQHGYSDIVNQTVRYFYVIKESGIHKSGIWIDGEKRFFEEGNWICCDMSREYSLFNKDKNENTIILFVDVTRPNNIRSGSSMNKDIKNDDILRLMFGNINDDFSVSSNEINNDDIVNIDDESEIEGLLSNAKH